MKVLVWTLIEIITLFVFSGALFIFLKRGHLKTISANEVDTQDKAEAAQSKQISSKSIATNEAAEQTLKRFIQHQMKQAVYQLSQAKVEEKNKKIVLIKLWGTLLKAENNILDNPSKEETAAILKKDLFNILQNIFNAKKDNKDLKELEQKLTKLIQSAQQSNEVFRLKTELECAQNAIKKELLLQISSLEGALSRLEIKKHELAHLELTLANASNNLTQLKKSLDQFDKDDEFKLLVGNESDKTFEEVKSDIKQDLNKHKANKQIIALNKVSNRQQAVIDLLREKLRELKIEELINIDESQEIAISRLEQLIKESDTLIVQLESELNSTNISIDALKSDIKIKSDELVASEKALFDAQKSALSSFRESAKKQQSKVDDINQQLLSAGESDKLKSMIQAQLKESKTLERLLKESETCATVLESELKNVRNINAGMMSTIKTVDPDFSGESQINTNNKFQQLESKHHQLLAEHSQIKQQLLASIEDDKENQLKQEVSRKNLEVERLELAIESLEQKQSTQAKI